MKNTQKGFAPLLIVLLIAVVVGVGIYMYSRNINTQLEGVSSNVEVTPEATNSQSASSTSLSKHIGVSYGFSYPSDWELRATNPRQGTTLLFPKSKTDLYMKRSLPITDSIGISLIEKKNIDSVTATKVTLNGEVWYVKTTEKVEGGTESALEYFKTYNDTQYVIITSGVSNKNTIETIAESFVQG